jgi:S1-C subfamily serine protease
MTDGHDNGGAEVPDYSPAPPPVSPLSPPEHPPVSPPSSGWDPGWPPPPTWGYPPGWEPAPQSGAPRRRRRPGRLVALVAVVVLVGGIAGAGIGHLVWATPSSVTATARNNPPASRGNPGTGQSPGGGYNFPFGPGSSGNGGTTREGAGGPSDVKSIAAKITPALVDINTTFNYQGAAGAGTGIVLTSNGEVLTNNHVVDGATSISVTDLGNGRRYSASVVGYDPVHDMAVIQLKNASGLKAASLGDSAASKVGQPVVAVGNAGGKGGTPTSTGGSITGLSKSINASDSLDGTTEHLHGLIQVNADVESGDSGGSLVNSSGQVIGMDTAAEHQFNLQAPASRGYAIPIDQALTTAHAIEAGQGSADIHVGATAFLGVLISSAQQNQGAQPGQGSSAKGATIVRAVPGGPVAKAGLTAGDIITSLDGHSVTSSAQLSRLMITHHPGDHVTLGWMTASGHAHTSTVTLASGPPS